MPSHAVLFAFDFDAVGENSLIAIVLGVAGLGCSIAWLFWVVVGRSLALKFGYIRPKADDFLVLAWEAERLGRWDSALAAYDKALHLDPESADAKERRANLLQEHPELDGGKPPRI